MPNHAKTFTQIGLGELAVDDAAAQQVVTVVPNDRLAGADGTLRFDEPRHDFSVRSGDYFRVGGLGIVSDFRLHFARLVDAADADPVDVAHRQRRAEHVFFR